MNIEIVQGNILDQKVSVIINPTNLNGYMGYGVGKAIVRAGGIEIENQAVAKAPILIGEPVMTTAGSLPFEAIIHTSTIDDSSQVLEKGLISKSLLGALLTADEAGFESVAVPGMGSGVGKLSVKDTAQAMFSAIEAFKPIHLKNIILVDLDLPVIMAWKELQKK